MLNKLRQRIASFISPGRAASYRMYHAAKNSRLTDGFGSSNTSADSELASSLTTLRARSRQLIRDSAYAKRARMLVVNNVIGDGVGMQAQVRNAAGKKLNTRVNDDIELAWNDWCMADSCHVGGQLGFSDMERLCMGEMFEAGEVFLRMHYSAFGNSSIPFALEVIESERLADEYQFAGQPGAIAPNHMLRMGVEMDEFYRPIAYWIRERHPSEFRVGISQRDRLERVPASQIIHLRSITRWPQTRGEPWLHAVIRKLNDMDGYTEAELVAARGAANYMATIETDDEVNTLGQVTNSATGEREVALSPGETFKLNPGEKLNFVAPNRPNSQIDPFMRMMLREVAAGCGPSYESLSRDYSQSNYSSSRLALLDDRDLWRVMQGAWMRNVRSIIHKAWMHQAVLARAIPSIGIEQYAIAPKRFEDVCFRPRGWSWVDPTKEVEAYISAVRAGFMTVADVIALTGGGRDLEEVLTQRLLELEMMKEKGLRFDTDVVQAEETENQPAKDDDGQEDENENPRMRVLSLKR